MISHRFPLCRGAFITITVLLSLVSVRAQFVTISFGAGTLYDSSGNAMPSGGLVLLVADTAQDGFGAFTSGSSLSVGSLLDGDDQILGRAFTASDAAAAATFASIPLADNPSPGLFTSLTTGDSLALVWLPSLDSATAQLSLGDSYGLFSSTSSSDDGAAWKVPGAGQTIAINFLTFSGGGTHAESSAYATQSAVPEPAAYTLVAAAAALGIGLIRRLKTRRR